LRGGTIAAAVAASPASATPALPSVGPTKLGLTFIAAVAEHNTAFAAGGDDGPSDDKANAITDRLYAKIGPLADEINATPIDSFSSIVDRSLVAASRLGGASEIRPQDILPLADAVLALAGLRAEDHML